MRRVMSKRRRSGGAAGSPERQTKRDPRWEAQDALGNRGMLRLMRKHKMAAAGGTADRERVADAAADRAMRDAPAGAHGSRSDRTLPESTRAWLERAYGVKLGGLRIQADDMAARSAGGEKADAFTEGKEIHFGAGRYAPQTRQGQRLIAHEVAHVLQQAPTGERTVQRQQADEVAANQILPFAQGDRLVQASTGNEEALNALLEQAKLVSTSQEEIDSVERSLNQIRHFAPVGQSFELNVTESSADAVVAEQDPKTVAPGKVARRLELRRIGGSLFTLTSVSPEETVEFTVNAEKQDDGSWKMNSRLLNGQEFSFVIEAPMEGGKRRVHIDIPIDMKLFTRHVLLDLVEITPLGAGKSADEVARESFDAAYARAQAAGPRTVTLSGGVGYLHAFGAEGGGQPLLAVSLRKRFAPFAGNDFLTFPVGFDVAGWASSMEDEPAFLISPRAGIELMVKPGTFLNLQAGLTLGTLPGFPTGKGADDTKSKSIFGIEGALGVGKDLGPFRGDLLLGGTIGIEETPYMASFLFMIGKRFK